MIAKVPQSQWTKLVSNFLLERQSVLLLLCSMLLSRVLDLVWLQTNSRLLMQVVALSLTSEITSGTGLLHSIMPPSNSVKNNKLLIYSMSITHMCALAKLRLIHFQSFLEEMKLLLLSQLDAQRKHKNTQHQVQTE